MKFLMRYILSIFLVLFFAVTVVHAQSLQDAFRYAGTGVIAQKLKLTLIAQNLANFTTLEDSETGLPWQKRFAVLKPSDDGVRVVSIEKSTRPFGVYFDPAVPMSNAEGFTAYPNVNLPDEMVDMTYSEVVFEANINSIKTTKGLYKNFIDIMR